MATIIFKVPQTDEQQGIWARLQDSKHYSDNELNSLQAFMAIIYQVSADKILVTVQENQQPNNE